MGGSELHYAFLFAVASSKVKYEGVDGAFPLDIAANFFNNLGPDVREFLISEGVQVPPRPPTETNHQVNHRLL